MRLATLDASSETCWDTLVLGSANKPTNQVFHTKNIYCSDSNERVVRLIRVRRCLQHLWNVGYLFLGGLTEIERH